MASYLVKEEDGTSRLTLEEASGSILLEESSAAPVTVTPTGGIVSVRRNVRQPRLIKDDEDLAALMILLRPHRRLRLK